MAFVALNGFDVEHASNLLVMENLFPEIQHLNGKGSTDKYTKTDDVKSVTYIDVMRVLPYAPRFRKLGASNGKWHNANNVGGINNAPESEKYTIPVDMWYDEGIQISSPQIYSNPIELKAIVTAQLIKAAGMSVNVITHAKQWEGFFRDSFSDVPTAEELTEAIFAYNSATASNLEGSAVDAFIEANSVLSDGVPEIGAFTIPMDKRQAFISNNFDRVMKRQYQTNASEAAAQILATGYINPFTGEEARINMATGLAGMYDGIPMFIFNKSIRRFMYVALGAPENESTLFFAYTGDGITKVEVDKETFETKVAKATDEYEFEYDATATAWKLGSTTVTLSEYGITITGTAADKDTITVDYSAKNGIAKLLDEVDAVIVYGEGTVRGIVGPTVKANPNPFQGGVYLLPQMKVGVEVLNGKTIKFVTKSEWTADTVKQIRDYIKFTPIDGVDVKAEDVFGTGVFNSGLSN